MFVAQGYQNLARVLQKEDYYFKIGDNNRETSIDDTDIRGEKVYTSDNVNVSHSEEEIFLEVTIKLDDEHVDPGEPFYVGELGVFMVNQDGEDSMLARINFVPKMPAYIDHEIDLEFSFYVGRVPDE